MSKRLSDSEVASEISKLKMREFLVKDSNTLRFAIGTTGLSREKAGRGGCTRIEIEAMDGCEVWIECSNFGSSVIIQIEDDSSLEKFAEGIDFIKRILDTALEKAK